MSETVMSHPWMDASKPALERANLLLSALSQEQKIQMALALTGEQGKALLGGCHIPPLEMRDGPNGVRGETGVTAFPSAQALAATFNPALAQAYGTAVGAELRGKGANTWLGPAMDIARTPLAGRQAEALGEDPYLAGQIAAAEVQGAKSQQVICMLKHFIANNQEYLRTGYAGKPPFGPHSPAIDVLISEKALQEIYYPPMKAAVQAGADAVMISYNRVNGQQACENAHILDTLRHDWDFQGFSAPDFAFAIRDALAAVQAGMDLPALDESQSAGRTAEMFTSGQVSPERLDDLCRRILFAKFDAGLFDHPAGPAAEVVSSPAHQALARRIAEESLVLLKNDSAILPLSTDKNLSIAVIGTAREDAQWIMGGSAGVTMSLENAVTPLAGISARLGESGSVVFSQGTLGDVPLPPVPDGVLTPTGSPQAGLLGQYWNNPDQQGQPVLTRVDPRLEGLTPPAEIADSYPWSARWTGTLHVPASGLYRFALLAAGIARLYINDQLVASGYREATRFFHGPLLPIQGTLRLEAGTQAAVRIEYCSGAALFGGELSLGWQPPHASLIPAAVETARHTDIAIVFASTATGEGMDRSSLSLPGDQDALIQAVAEANPRTVVVLNTGGPVLMPWLKRAAAVIQAWYPGEQYGAALAAVLFGDSDPGGRLPVTFPADEQQGPAPAGLPELYPGVDGVVQYAEGVLVGHRWYDQHQQAPLFPFGYGLSYARFSYQDLAVRLDHTTGGVEIRVRVENTSSRPGWEVVQLYLTLPEPAGAPAGQLKGFEKVWLAAGASKTLSFTLNPQDLMAFDALNNQWRLYPGVYQVGLGSSSRQLGQWQRFDYSLPA